MTGMLYNGFSSESINMPQIVFKDNLQFSIYHDKVVVQYSSGVDVEFSSLETASEITGVYPFNN